MDVFAQWTRRLRASDTGACTEVFEHMHQPLLRYAAQLIHDHTAAYDVVQDVFLNLWRTRATLRPERSLRALLYTMVRNRCFNYNRDRKAESVGLQLLPPRSVQAEPHLDAQHDANVIRQQVQAWITELPKRRREAFLLSRYEGLRHEEIAEVMGLTKRTVTNHIMLALQHLRERLHAFEALPNGTS